MDKIKILVSEYLLRNEPKDKKQNNLNMKRSDNLTSEN